LQQRDNPFEPDQDEALFAAPGSGQNGGMNDLNAPVPYMARTRAYYLALGYNNPYEWAHFDDVPFQPLTQPLAGLRVTLVTTAAPFQPDKGPQGPRAPYNAGPKFYQVYSGDTAQDHDVRVAHVAIDRKHTHMEDRNSWFPLPVMRRLAQSGRFVLAPRFHGVPTNRSQRHTLEVDVPELIRRCREDCCSAIFRWATGLVNRTIPAASKRRWSSRCSCSNRLRQRAPLGLHPRSGVTTAAGNWITPTLSA